MAKNINVSKKSDLLDKVTGRTPQQAQQVKVAPPAVSGGIEGIRGTLPLGTGTVVADGEEPSRYTEEERRMLKLLNIGENEELPSNMAEILQKAGLTGQQFADLRKTVVTTKNSQNEFVPPVPLDTPPIGEPPTVPLESLPAEKQQELLAAIANANAMRKQAQVDLASDREIAALPIDVQQAVLSANTATRPVTASPNQRTEKTSEREPTQSVRIGDAQTPPAVKPAKPTPVAPPQPEPPAPTEAAPSTFAGDTLQFCPHCHFNLSHSDGVKVTDEDKLAFLQTLIGDKPFTKTYALYGGKLMVAFRVLSVTELDAIFAQVQYEVRSGLLQNVSAVEEKLQRYRMFLQLVYLVADSYRHDFPDGFTRETNPNAQAFWELPDDLPEGSKGIECVEHYMASSVIKTESMQRILTLTCNEFNRLAAKMEATSPDSDFWQATAQQL